jgi:PKD repeat protein
MKQTTNPVQRKGGLLPYLSFALLMFFCQQLMADTLNQSNLSGATGSTTYFTLAVPSGASNLAFTTSGGSGNADLYVRFGTRPTTSSYNCRPYLSGNTESCRFATPQVGTYHVMLRGRSAYSGVSLTGTYAGGNMTPQAVIANGPYTAQAGQAISFSSAGSNDPDGSIVTYAWTFGDGATSTQANPSHSYASAGSYPVTLTVTDNGGARSSASANVTITNVVSGFNASSHYYDKGSFDYHYTNYDAAFSDNYTDTDVEIHSHIVINFNADVNPSTVAASAIQVKRLDMPDNAENNQNLVSGSFQLIGPRQAVFKPAVIYYTNPGGTFDWNNANWNGLKPNYRYSVSLSSAIKSTSGSSLNTSSEEASWTFKTIDNDYGLYWYKDAVQAVKYVPGRELPLEFYDPAKPTLVFAHGWSKTSVNFQSGKLRDYRREPMTFSPGSMYPSQPAVDLVSIWKNPAKNYEGKAWNVGTVVWNQFADDDYANLSKPQMAEAKIWSTSGKGGMRYAIRSWNGSSWSTGNTNVTTNAPMKPVSVILADAFIAGTREASNPELRLSGESLGNQVVTGMTYILKKEYAEGRIGPKSISKASGIARSVLEKWPAGE